MGKLVACPFCREMFQHDEQKVCPSCGLEVAPMSKLGPSYDAELEDDWPREPEWETLPLTFWRRSRGPLVVLAVIGIVAFFLPWISMTAPEIATLGGNDLARKIPWLWACLVSWVMLAATVASRRSIARMRGARVVSALFSAIPLVSAVIVFAMRQRSHWIPIRYEHGLGLYLTAAISIVALPFAVKFGGRLDDLPSGKGSGKGQVLH